jgi:hypothetical protein
MNAAVTPAMIHALNDMHLVETVDGREYRNTYQSVSVPELTRVARGPSRLHLGLAKPSTAPHSVHFYVNGIEVSPDVDSIADAINAVRGVSGRLPVAQASGSGGQTAHSPGI